MTNSIQVRGLRVTRSGREVLHGIDADLPAGQVTGLIGPSGSGKSTLIRALVGVQRISGGSITVLGHPAGSPALRRQVGYSGQSAAVYPDLTVAQNLRYFAAVRRDDPAEVRRAIDLVGLTGRENQLAGALSGGQRSRVSLAVALLGRSRLIVLDEPTVGLDPVLRAELWQLFGDLAADGVTLLISSHAMDEAQRCDRLMLLREGRLLFHDTPARLLERTGEPDAERGFVSLVHSAEVAA
ncbi:ABC transporter ATP-binding protein [Kineosporia rhizophila]|uniref:ABC transporter ATP-binding protein n=1 Tax=Kineosporia TaxID=49184 RepID=UPI001E4023E3|nr:MULTISPECIES: ABC transporter ATP-binding protein [Kineosporia]MCE0534775.1 ABC transporter ATP-binding protein [Kineosporia rhizophila]GLY19298.1 multidrug ABC transporter ATP-binding protein [Kineosporia sp. NBRC 101677]